MELNGDHFRREYLDELRTKTAERLIAPLIQLVVAFREDYEPQGAGRHDAPSVLARVRDTLERFVAIGQRIIGNIEGAHREKLNAALIDVRNAGTHLYNVGAQFVQNTGNKQLREQTIAAGRAALEAVVRLLVLSDFIDTNAIVDRADKVRHHLNETEKADTKKQLEQRSASLVAEMEELTEITRKRVRDLRDEDQQDDLQAAISVLKAATPMLIASSRAFVTHPELEAARLNREYSFRQAHNALDCINDVLNDRQPSSEVALSRHGQLSDLIKNLETFQQHAYMEPSVYKPHIHRPKLEELVELIATGAANIADLDNTRPNRRDHIIAGVNNLREALQDLLTQYENNIGKHEPTEELDLSTVHLAHKIKDLRRHLRRAIVDHVSDAFVDTSTPLMLLVKAAREGDVQGTNAAARAFMAHANNLVDVARLVCEMSNDVEGVRLTRYAAQLCELLAPQVVNAAQLLCEKKDSPVLQDNMRVFEEAWLDRLKVLTMATDALVSVEDFLAVAEAHLEEDIKQAIKAILDKNDETLDNAAGCIRLRAKRICDVVDGEMEQLPPTHYSENVKQASRRLRDVALQRFAREAENLVSEIEESNARGAPRDTEPDVERMITAGTIVHNSVNEIRQALLMNRNPEDVDSDNEYEEEGATTVPGDNRSQVSDEGENQQRIMRHLPEESKKEIQRQIDVFKITQRKFEYEVGKWDETGNDIIALAKHMCHIMMNMTDFTKGRGPYRTTMDVIKAAQEISEDGAKLRALAKQIGDDSVESATKKDLLAYLERIALYTHQLNITSRVKADVQVVGDELRVSGLEAATSLIQNAKNLLNAVILTVKSAYIASTKYRLHGTQSSVVQWRMAPPQKQPLVRPEQPKTSGIIRRASERKQPQPMEVLGQIHIR